MTRQVVEGDALAKVHCAIIERLPVPIEPSRVEPPSGVTVPEDSQIQLQVVGEIDAGVRTSRNRPKG